MDNYNDHIKALLFRSSYFPKLNHLALSQILKLRKFDNHYFSKVMKRFDRL